MHSTWLTKLERALRKALRKGHPLRLGPLNAAPPVDKEVANALLKFFNALVERLQAITEKAQEGGAPPFLRLLVEAHLDSAVEDFFSQHMPVHAGRPGAPSTYATGGADCFASDAQKIAHNVNNVYLRRRVMGFSQDGFAAEKTMYALSDAFNFVGEMPVRSRRLLIATDGRRPRRKRTRRGPLQSMEHCARCESWTERYIASMQPPSPRIPIPGAEPAKIRWRDVEVVLHEPLPKIIRPGNAEFCKNCKSDGPDYDTANERKFAFSSLINSVELYKLVRDYGADRTSYTIRRVARILSRPKVEDAVASITTMLKKNAARAEEAIKEFFGVPLPDDLGIARGEITSIGAAAEVGVFYQSAVAETSPSPMILNINIDSDHAQRAVDRAAAWCGLRSGLPSIAFDIPDLGLVLRANAGEYWQINANIDRAANYEWITLLDAEVVKAIVQRTRKCESIR